MIEYKTLEFRDGETTKEEKFNSWLNTEYDKSRHQIISVDEIEGRLPPEATGKSAVCVNTIWPFCKNDGNGSDGCWNGETQCTEYSPDGRTIYTSKFFTAIEVKLIVTETEE